MKYATVLLLIITHFSANGQRKWVGLWDMVSHKFDSCYALSADSIDAYNIIVSHSGIFLMCIADNEKKNCICYRNFG